MKNYGKINREFPDFGELNIVIDSRFKSDSWHNDTCPSFRFTFANENYLKIWVDYKEVEKREDQNQERFMLSFYDADDQCIDMLMLSDNFDDITSELNRFLLVNPKETK